MILDCVHIMVNGDLLHCTGTVWCGVVTLFIMRAPRKISPFHLHMERWYTHHRPLHNLPPLWQNFSASLKSNLTVLRMCG